MNITWPGSKLRVKASETSAAVTPGSIPRRSATDCAADMTGSCRVTAPLIWRSTSRAGRVVSRCTASSAWAIVAWRASSTSRSLNPCRRAR
jgi:hypothetical protein